jgi:hypothetical protein
VVVDELKIAALTLQKIAGKTKSRRNSADLKDLKEARATEGSKPSNLDLGGAQVEPIFDPVTGVRLFHIASLNLHESKIISRNIMAEQTWFTKVMAEIYRCYSQLASSIAPNLKRSLRETKPNGPESGGAYDEICAYLDNNFTFGIPGHFVDDQNNIYAAKHIQRTGGRIYDETFKNGVTVWEQGTSLSLPLLEG